MIDPKKRARRSRKYHETTAEEIIKAEDDYYGLSEYLCRWPEEAMTGRELFVLARTPLLKEYYRQRPNESFLWGYQPREEGLRQLEEYRKEMKVEPPRLYFF